MNARVLVSADILGLWKYEDTQIPETGESLAPLVRFVTESV